jgi:hypothetical protein
MDAQERCKVQDSRFKVQRSRFKVYVHGWTYAAGAWMRRSGARFKEKAFVRRSGGLAGSVEVSETRIGNAPL